METRNCVNRRQSLACAITFACSSIALNSAVSAQNAAEQTAPVEEEITITGSRIRYTDGMATPTPVTALTPEELASFEPGATVAEQLDALPQFFATQTAQRGGLALSGDAGASFLNMRSLGNNRTLVLLDGARMAPADKRGPVNVDTFPTALVRTVDVVTGGASAAYGADALGGVTNFIIDREFRGLKINTGTGVTEFGDGSRWNYSIAGGFEVGERANIIASFEDRYIEQIDRDPLDLDPSWFQRWGHVTNPAWSPGAPAGIPQRLTMPWIAPTDRHVYGMITDPRMTTMNGMVFNREGTAVRPFEDGTLTSRSGTGTTNSTSGGPEADLANRAYPGPIDGAEVVGRSLFVAAKYDFTDNFSAYVQGVSGRSESNQDPGRADTLGINLRSIWAPRIAVDNAYLPDAVRNVMVANNVSEFILSRDGAFLDELDMGIDQKDRNTFTTTTWTVGFDWDLPSSWSLSGSYSTGETERLSFVENMMRIDRLFLAMDAVRDPATGAIVCRVNLPQYSPTEEDLRASPVTAGHTNSRTDASASPERLAAPIGLDNTVEDCVPFNVMGFGNISQEAIDYVGTDKWSVGIVEQDFAEIVATGDVHKGWGHGAVSAAFGLTWRESRFSDSGFPEDIDALGPPLNDPDLGIRGIPPGYTGGSPYLHQFSSVPLIGGEYDVWEWFTELQAPIWESQSRSQRLGGSVAFRRSDYNLSGPSDSWKAGLEFQIVEGLRFRATKSRDVREASFSERFDSQGGGANVRDPVFLGRNSAITVIASGNPNLNPEIADTRVAGLVFQPRRAEAFSFAADWYDVDIADSIEQIGAQDVVDRCFGGDTAQCVNVERDSVTNEISRVFRLFYNQAKAKVEGIDLEVVYRADPDFFAGNDESLSVRLLGGKLLAREDISADGTVTDLMGPYTLPDVSANVTTTYGLGRWSFQLQGRFEDGGKLVRTWVEGVDVDDNSVPSSTWWNGSVRYRGQRTGGATWDVGLAVQNLFDRDPPITPGGTAGAQGLLSNQYDVFGRRYNLSFNISM
jgi:outer membrane receptor protein involved in Fe transport